MSKTFLTSFATPDFEPFQNEMIKSANTYGIVNGFNYDLAELNNCRFYSENIDTFQNKKGFGYWLWKPYLILETMKKVKENDIVLYVDSGAKFISDPTPIINIAKNNDSGIVSFDAWPLTNHQWTKRETFVNLDLDTPDFWYADHIIATIMLFRKSLFTLNFVKEWLSLCENIVNLSDFQFTSNNIDGFIEHRHDQSIFSLLIKRENIKTYRNPSKWGNFLKLPEFRKTGEFVGYPYLVKNTIQSYSSAPYLNSPYDTVLEFNRKQNSIPESNSNNTLINRIRKRAQRATRKLFSKLGTIMGYQIKRKNSLDLNYSKQSFSQCGEDLIVQYIFNLRNLPNPSYLDIGANHPYFISNTAVFYQKGCKGINVEANPALLECFTLLRPNDINLNIGIGRVSGEMDFYIMEDDTLSTFSKEESERMISSGNLLKEIKKIKLITIQDLLDQYCAGTFPDFLSLDVEGFDLDILKTINFEKSSPKIICVEAAEYSTIGAGARREELINFLVTEGYYEYANTNLNAIMVKRDFWFTNE